jgi:hypothetical protein
MSRQPRIAWRVPAQRAEHALARASTPCRQRPQADGLRQASTVRRGGAGPALARPARIAQRKAHGVVR